MTLPRWIARWWAPPESICEQRLRAWFPEAYADRQAGRVPPATSGAAVVRADDGAPTAPEQERAPGCSFDASPVPTVQREIELRALLDAAWQHRHGELVVIHAHQTDQHGEEIRN